MPPAGALRLWDGGGAVRGCRPVVACAGRGSEAVGVAHEPAGGVVGMTRNEIRPLATALVAPGPRLCGDRRSRWTKRTCGGRGSADVTDKGAGGYLSAQCQGGQGVEVYRQVFRLGPDAVALVLEPGRGVLRVGASGGVGRVTSGQSHMHPRKSGEGLTRGVFAFTDSSREVMRALGGEGPHLTLMAGSRVRQ
jgi:hypothetical protein